MLMVVVVGYYSLDTSRLVYSPDSVVVQMLGILLQVETGFQQFEREANCTRMTGMVTLFIPLDTHPTFSKQDNW